MRIAVQPTLSPSSSLRPLTATSSFHLGRSAAAKLNGAVPFLAYLHSAVVVLALASGRFVVALLVAAALARIVQRVVAAPAGNLGLVQ